MRGFFLPLSGVMLWTDLLPIQTRIERGGVLLETAVSLPILASVIFVAFQLLYAAQVSFRLDIAADAGARHAARITGVDRAAETEAAIMTMLGGLSVADIEFCPVATLLPSGVCPSGSGRRNPGDPGEHLFVRAAAFAPLGFLSAPLRLTAVRVIRNEAY